MNNKKKEGGTGSECEQLLRRDVPLAFENSVHGDNIWNEKLASVKSFILRTGRIPSRPADDDMERHLEELAVNVSSCQGGKYNNFSNDKSVRQFLSLCMEYPSL